jgi:hypothetical protein
VTLGVELINNRDIVVSNPESGFSVTYRKDGDAPMLVAGRRHRPSCRSSEGEILGASLEGGPSEGPGDRLAELVDPKIWACADRRLRRDCLLFALSGRANRADE